MAGSGTSSYLGYAIPSLYDARRQLFYCNTNGYTGIGWVVGDGTFARLISAPDADRLPQSKCEYWYHRYHLGRALTVETTQKQHPALFERGCC